MSASAWGALPLAAEGERALRRSLGPTAWAVLADLCLDAEPAGAGAHVVATSARKVGAHLGITKDTAARALRRLIAAGVVRRRPQGAGVAGRFTSGSYELHLPFPLTATPCRPDEDTVGSTRRKSANTEPVAIAVSPAKATVLAAPAQRRTRASIRPDFGQLSLLDPAPADGGGMEPSR
jgi:hypothetical protein